MKENCILFVITIGIESQSAKVVNKIHREQSGKGRKHLFATLFFRNSQLLSTNYTVKDLRNRHGRPTASYFDGHATSKRRSLQRRIDIRSIGNPVHPVGAIPLIPMYPKSLSGYRSGCRSSERDKLTLRSARVRASTRAMHGGGATFDL